MSSPKRLLLFLGMAVLLGASSAEVRAQERRPPRREAVPNEYVVKVRPGLKIANLGDALAAPKLEVVRVFPRIDTVQVRVPAPERGTVAPTAMKALERNPIVQRIEPNYLYYKDQGGPSVPDDQLLDRMWFLDRISAFRAWEAQKDSPDIVVAVIDTGVFLGHEDLDGRIWVNRKEIPGNGVDDDNNGYVDDEHGWDFANDDNDPAPDPVEERGRKAFEEHGTHVSGTIGAVANNGKGIAGISWKVQIMPLKFLGGPEGSGSLANAAAAIDYAVANGARIINASWGGTGHSEILKEAIAAADEAGVLMVVAAGNGNDQGIGQDNDRTPEYPASYDLPNLVAVAATQDDDNLTPFSNFGRISVHLAAPGRKILSTVPERQGDAEAPSSGYKSLDGTSMATPLVTGTAALAMARFPDRTHLQIKELLLRTVDPVPSLADKVASGGRLDVAGVVTGDLRRPSPGGPSRVPSGTREVPPGLRPYLIRQPADPGRRAEPRPDAPRR